MWYPLVDSTHWIYGFYSKWGYLVTLQSFFLNVNFFYLIIDAKMLYCVDFFIWYTTSPNIPFVPDVPRLATWPKIPAY